MSFFLISISILTTVEVHSQEGRHPRSCARIGLILSVLGVL